MPGRATARRSCSYDWTARIGRGRPSPDSELAAWLGAQLVLLQVVPLPPFGLYAEAAEYLAFDSDAQVMEARRYLAEVAGRLSPTVSQVRVRVDVGCPAAATGQAALEEKANLICMATHGRGGNARLLLGSVAAAAEPTLS